MRLILPDNAQIQLPPIDTAIIAKSQQEARENGNTLAGVISRIVMGGFGVAKSGEVRVEVVLDGTPYRAGALNFKMPATSTPPAMPSTAH